MSIKGRIRYFMIIIRIGTGPGAKLSDSEQYEKGTTFSPGTGIRFDSAQNLTLH
jgi:hypothetical protein